MKCSTLAIAFGAALAVATASAAPPASQPPPITGGVRAPGGFNYPYTGGTSLSTLRPGSSIYARGRTGPAFGFQGSRYPLGAAPLQSRVVWYW